MLAGRAAEEAAIDELVARARAGAGGALIVRGEPGIGKTALVEHAVRAAQGMLLLRGDGHAAEERHPFAALHLLLGSARDHAAALPCAQAEALAKAFDTGTVDEDRRHLVRLGTFTLLTELAARAPLLCVIDDAHWLDPDSADVLSFVARRLAARPAALLLAARDHDPQPFPGLPEVRPRRLRPAMSEALAGRDQRVSAPARVAIARESDGNPQAVLELTGCLTPAQRAGRINPYTFHDGTRAPSGAAYVEFRARQRRLPGAVRTLLRVAAADGTGSLGLVIAAAEALGASLTDLGRAERHGILLAGGPDLSFTHPLHRAAAYHDATTAERRAAHLALADAVPAEQAACRAWHRAAAAKAPDEAIAAELERVAAAATGGPAYAAYERAAVLSPIRADRARRLVAAAGAGCQAGLLDAALELVTDADALDDEPRTRTASARVRAAVEYERGGLREACRMLTGAAAAIGGTDPEEALLMLTEAGDCGWQVGDPALLRAIHDAVLGVELPAGSPLSGLPPALAALTTALSAGARASGPPVFTLVDAALRAIPADRRHRFRAASIDMADASGGGTDLAERHVADCLARGRTGLLPAAYQALAEGRIHRGLHHEAAAAAQEGLRLAVELGHPHRAGHLRCLLAWLAAVHGDEARCAELVATAAVHAKAQGILPTLALGAWALALLDLSRGRNDAALVRLERLPRGESDTAAVLRAPDHVEAAVRAGRPDLAEAPLELLGNWAGHHPGCPQSAAAAARARALAAEGPRAEAHYAEALRLHEQVDQPYEEARTRLAYGEWLRRARRRGEARPLLAAAADAFDLLGARPWAARARLELKATGPDGGGGRSGFLLTCQELEVVRLAAAGATNRDIAARLFLSPRTVGNHLYRAFPKLGIRSRAELGGLDLDGLG